MTYDAKCHDLARHFLREYDLNDKARDDLADELAQVIQRAVEGFLIEHFGEA